MKKESPVIGFASRPARKGGPGSFQSRFEKTIKAKGWRVVYPDIRITPDIIIINGTTRHLKWLLLSKFQGARIIFRLGGINWLYKHNSEVSVLGRAIVYMKHRLMVMVQHLLCDLIIYQSEFSKEWLVKLGQSAGKKRNTVIFNGVDTNVFRPQRDENTKGISLLCVEGNIDYTPYAIPLLNYLYNKFSGGTIVREINIYGDFENLKNRKKINPGINYHGLISKEHIHEVYQNAVFLSLDINPACPNSVLEALSSGIPVVGYKTGALEELVPDNTGKLVSYKGNPWNLDIPDFEEIALAIEMSIADYEILSANAESIAKERYSIDDVVERYLKAISEIV